MQTFDQISLDPVFGWYTLVPVAVLLIASLWLSFSSQGLSKSRRLLLFLIRLGAMLVLLIGWLQPGFVSEVTRQTPGAIAVLMDRSESMTLPSDSRNLSRWQAQQEVWERIASTTDLSLGETKIVPYFYADELVAASSDQLPLLTPVFEESPAGKTTDLGRALAEVSKMQIDPPLRGVILIGDGTQTANTAIAPSVTARQMAQLDQPIMMVGLGDRGDESQIRDVAIEGLPEHYSAFVKKELGVRLVVNSKGMQNQPIRLQLILRSSGAEDQIVASREILAARADQLIPQDFTIQVPEVGDYLLEAVATVDTEDQIPSNNRALSFITVREGGAKILCIDGPPRFEQRYLRLALNDSLDFDVDYLPLSELDRRQRGNRGAALDEIVSLQRYDAIILGDVAASELDAETQRILRQHVQAGAGILFMGGYHSYDAGGYGTSLLEPLFPIRLSRKRPQSYDGPIDRSFHIEGDVKLRIRTPHPITAIQAEPENSAMWSALPPLNGMNRLGDLKNDPGIQILLESSNGDPILVKGQSGRGRVLAFAGDSTWKWWLSGNKKISKQFWRQAVLWLISRETLNEGFKLSMETRRLLIDQTPDLTLEWFGGSDNLPMPDNVRVELSLDGKNIQSLVPSKSDDSFMQVRLSGLSKEGLYRAKLSAKSNEGKTYESEIAFVVRDESRELARPDADWQMMRNIVAANQLAEGQLVMPDEIDNVIQLLRDRQQAAQVTSIEKRRLGDSAWDSWLFLVVFCVLMSVEWSLRKSWQLP